MTIDRVARAIASFERTLLSGDSPYGREAARTAAGPFSAGAQRGLTLFFGQARCALGHRLPLFTDDGFHNTGVGWGSAPPDLGRYEVTGRDDDRGRFRTPPLRDVARTAPYMHNGSLATLEAVVDFYNRGGRPNPSLDTFVRPLGLTDGERADLIVFLRSLSGAR